MAHKKATTSVSVKNDCSQSDQTSQDASQDAGLSVGHMTETFTEQVKKRTSERRQERQALVKANHDDRVHELRATVKVCFVDHGRKLRALRRPNVERLIVLARKKRELETRIDKGEIELARTFLEAAQQLQASIGGRVHDLAA